MDLMGDELDSYELDGDDVLGDDVLGTALVGTYGVGRAARHHAKRRAKPRWRNQMAPGVPEPGYGVFPIPLTPQTNGGIFTSSVTNIEFRTVAQIPFRGERLLTQVSRNGAAGILVQATNGVHIGIRPQVGVLGPLNLENYSRDAFGVRLVMQPATQGAEIRVFAFVSSPPTGTDTIALSIEILGRVAT